LCEEKCPRKVPDEKFEVGLGQRKSIYMPFPQAVPRIPVLDRDSCIWFERGKCGACKKLCPTGAVDFDQQDEILDLDVGNIVMATGYELFDPEEMPQYGYGRLANVFTSLEFERMCNAAGPTGGRVVLRDGKSEPRSIAIVHCVGSRDRNHNPYCSNVCCMSALKFGHLAMEKTPAKVTSFYLDMRTAFKDYDEFYQRLLDEGMSFVRGKVAEVTDAARLPGEEGMLIVQVEDTLVGKQRRVPVDMVVLMCALEPQQDAKEMGLKCGISCSMAGWFTERHPKLDPVATMTDGIFVAGACQGPKDIPASVAQGAAAAARVQGMISRGKVLIEPIVATIHEENCSGCRICNNLCPFNAIEYVADKEVSCVTPELCKGCGTCVAACPAHAITGAHYDDTQILAEIEGLLWDASTPSEEAA
jgi:heterodisulfide reductase subunit A